MIILKSLFNLLFNQQTAIPLGITACQISFRDCSLSVLELLWHRSRH